MQKCKKKKKKGKIFHGCVMISKSPTSDYTILNLLQRIEEGRSVTRLLDIRSAIKVIMSVDNSAAAPWLRI